MKNYDPPAGNLTIEWGAVDFQTRTFSAYYHETMQWVGFNLNNGNSLWGPTATEVPFDYYETPKNRIYAGQMAYGNLYDCCFGGVLLLPQRFNWQV